MADVVAGDDEIGALIGNAAHEQMDVRIVGVPVIDRDPIEPRAQVGLHLPHDVARVFAQVGQFSRVLGRHDDPEMVPVILAPLGETAIVCVVAGRVEHPRWRAVAGDAFALQIRDVRGQRRRAPATPASGGHGQHLDHDAPARAEQATAGEGGASPPEGRLRTPSRSAGAAAPAATVDRGDAQHLGDQAAGIAALRLAALCLARPDAEVAVVAHGRAAFGRK